MKKPPEILAPVGNWEMLMAAVHNGAGAVYIGVPGFNARGRAETLSISTLKEMIEYAHLYGVKVHLALNILIFQQELADVLQVLREVIPLCPDAFIVQDIGLVRLIRYLAPEQEIHASTQMTVTDSEAIECTDELGMTRYVLGREVSIDEMKKIRTKTSRELEVFVHGALCVSYSGQCLTSESLGGRSANRGQCAQSCRLEYDLIVDGVVHDTQGRHHLVSPKDLCAVEDIPRLIEAGIDSFKIEGRLKSAAYVASSVRSYAQSAGVKLELPEVSIDHLRAIYSRDFFNGWMDGVNHQELVRGDYSSHQGLQIGTVSRIQSHGVVVVSKNTPQRGDGALFFDHETGRKIGGSLYDVRRLSPEEIVLGFGREFDCNQVDSGMLVFINSSPALEKEIERSYTDKALLKRIPVDVSVTGTLGKPLVVTVSDSDGNSVQAVSRSALASASSSPLTENSIKEEIGALGGTCFSLGNFDCKIDDSLFLNRKEIKELRREASRSLALKRARYSAHKMRNQQECLDWIQAQNQKHDSTESTTQLNVLIREAAQIEALRGLPLGTVYLDFEYGRDYSPSIHTLRELGVRVGIATTRILKPGEHGHLKHIEKLKPDVILIRNLGALHYFQESSYEIIGDFSLNISNSLSADWFLRKNLTRITPSYDLNQVQLSELLHATDSTRCEVTVHQYIPAFHMEHCVFAAFLSTGTSYRDCGRPCEKHRVELRDKKGALHPLKADAECRNTMFNGNSQALARLVPELVTRGVKHFRFEALFESPVQLRAKLKLYLELISGERTPDSALKELGVAEQYGVSEGQVYTINRYHDRKKESAPTPPLAQIAHQLLN